MFYYKLLKYKFAKVIIIVIVISPVNDDIIILDGADGFIFIMYLLNLISVEEVICGISSHPWSINFIER